MLVTLHLESRPAASAILKPLDWLRQVSPAFIVVELPGQSKKEEGLVMVHKGILYLGFKLIKGHEWTTQDFAHWLPIVAASFEVMRLRVRLDSDNAPTQSLVEELNHYGVLPQEANYP